MVPMIAPGHHRHRIPRMTHHNYLRNSFALPPARLCPLLPSGESFCAPSSMIGRNNYFPPTIIYTLCQSLCGKPSEYKGMDGPYPRACQHGINSLRHHGHMMLQSPFLTPKPLRTFEKRPTSSLS